MKTITRTLNTTGMTDSERDAAIKSMWDEIEQERMRQEIEPSLQRIEAMMKQIVNQKDI